MIPEAHPLFIVAPGASCPTVNNTAVVELEDWDIEHIKTKVNLGDLRARTALVVDAFDKKTVELWAWLAGYGNRYPDIVFKETVVDSLKIRWAAVKHGEKAARPGERLSEYNVVEGSESALDVAKPFNEDLDVLRRWSHLLIYHPVESVVQNYINILLLNGLRFRAGVERFVSVAFEEVSDLDHMRSAGAGARQAAFKIDFPVVDPTDNPRFGMYVSTLLSVDMESLLLEMGTHRHGDNWHCPRPERHTNGDRNPSTKVVDNKVKCGRCDGEFIDALSLVIDVYGVSADDAVAILEGAKKVAVPRNASELAGWECEDSPQDILDDLFTVNTND